MKSKIISLCLLTLVLSVALISAATIDVSLSNDLSKSVSETTLKIENNNASSVTVVIPDVSDLLGNGIDLEQDVQGAISIGAGLEQLVVISYDSLPTNLKLGNFEGTIEVVDQSDSTNSDSAILKLTNNYCSGGNIGTLRVDKLKFANEGFGDRDEWYLTDEIKVDLRIENTGEDLDDVVVEWGLYNKDTGDFAIEEEESDFNLDEDEEEDLELIFNLDPDDFDEGDSENDYVFYVKAYSDDSGESVQCISEKEEITIKRDKHFTIVDNINLISETVPCGVILEGEFEVWNIGDSDEEDVLLLIHNSELGINEQIQVGDLDILEDSRITFSFKIPEDATEKTHILRFDVFDEDGDIFENDNNDESKFSKIFKVEGNCKGSTTDDGADVLITAELDSETPEAIPGKQVIIKATLRNTGDAETSYLISVFGNSAWSSLNSINPQTVTLESGESKDVNIILDIDPDAEGNKGFTIRASYGDELKEQKVALSISEGTGAVSGQAISDHLKRNWFIYVIVVINVILIIAIIAVIRRMVSSR